MIKVHRNLYDAQENDKGIEQGMGSVATAEPVVAEAEETVEDEGKTEEPVKEKKRKKAKKEEV